MFPKIISLLFYGYITFFIHFLISPFQCQKKSFNHLSSSAAYAFPILKLDKRGKRKHSETTYILKEHVLLSTFVSLSRCQYSNGCISPYLNILFILFFFFTTPSTATILGILSHLSYHNLFLYKVPRMGFEKLCIGNRIFVFNVYGFSF